jgi:hypothetical protein
MGSQKLLMLVMNLSTITTGTGGNIAWGLTDTDGTIICTNNGYSVVNHTALGLTQELVGFATSTSNVLVEISFNIDTATSTFNAYGGTVNNAANNVCLYFVKA